MTWPCPTCIPPALLPPLRSRLVCGKAALGKPCSARSRWAWSSACWTPWKDAMMVLTSRDKLGNAGRKTSFWLEEMVAPYYVFKDGCAEIVPASPKGGQPPLDPKSNEPSFQTDLTRRFEADAAKATPMPGMFLHLDLQHLRPGIANKHLMELFNLIVFFVFLPYGTFLSCLPFSDSH